MILSLSNENRGLEILGGVFTSLYHCSHPPTKNGNNKNTTNIDFRIFLFILEALYVLVLYGGAVKRSRKNFVNHASDGFGRQQDLLHRFRKNSIRGVRDEIYQGHQV